MYMYDLNYHGLIKKALTITNVLYTLEHHFSSPFNFDYGKEINYWDYEPF